MSSKQSFPTHSLSIDSSSPPATKVDPGHQIVLIPTPSSHPSDPLNWPLRKKYLHLLTLCTASLAASAAPAAHQFAYLSIARTYDETPTRLSYTLSAAIAGLLLGPFLLAPAAKLFGRVAVIFWCLVGAGAAQIWAATATGGGDYVSFAVSRAVAGLFAGVPTILGAGGIMDVFFLHQRGFAFATYELSFLLGVIAWPTIGGFIVRTQPWTWVFWWTLAPLGCSALLVAAVTEDTEFAPGRSGEVTVVHEPGETYLKRRIRVLTGYRVTPPTGLGGFLRCFVTPFVIGLSPATIMAGFYTFINFAWATLINVELVIFLQTPIEQGGYSFSAPRVAAFTFVSWVSLAVAQLFGTFYNDRVPIWLASRRKGPDRGRWHPEDRLWSMIMGPAILAPIGMGIAGVTLEYHLHYMVLALGYFLLTSSALLCVPVCVNYVAENFTGRAVEVSVAMNGYRLALAFSVGFFFQGWQKAVGVGWVFGMAAFFSVIAMIVLALLAWYGDKIRKLTLQRSLLQTEDGQMLTI